MEITQIQSTSISRTIEMVVPAKWHLVGVGNHWSHFLSFCPALSTTEGIILEVLMRRSSIVHRDHSGAIGSAIFLFP